MTKKEKEKESNEKKKKEENTNKRENKPEKKNKTESNSLDLEEKIFHPDPRIRIAGFLTAAFLLTMLVLNFVHIVEENIIINILLVIWTITSIFIIVRILETRAEAVKLKSTTVIHLQGILSRKKMLISHKHISEAHYNQSFMQRVFGVGTLEIDSPAGFGKSITVKDLHTEDLRKIMNYINESSEGVMQGFGES